MGVLNVTPDSFYDGGHWEDTQAATVRGCQMVEEGADIVDVGGESTRPGAVPVSEGEEARRVVPVIKELARRLGDRARISVDTRKSGVAEAAIDAGASIINDVSASMWSLAAQAGVGWVAMHMRGEPGSMMSLAKYSDVVSEVKAFLIERAEEAARAGVGEVWVDPGIGFAKTTGHNLALLAHLDELVATGWPVAVGLSRKRFIGALASGDDSQPAPTGDRLEGSVAGAVWAMVNGAAMVRAHDVKATADAAKLVGIE
jgi:dihydropteroate synthase